MRRIEVLEETIDVKYISESAIKDISSGNEKHFIMNNTASMNIASGVDPTSTDRTKQNPKSRTDSPSLSGFKKRMLENLGVNDCFDIGQEDEKLLHQFLEIRLEQERKEVEKLRDSNLKSLNTIIDKCIQTEKLTDDSINRILDLIYKPHREESIPSPDSKRRRLASPMMSPKGHRRFASEIPPLSTRELPPYQQLQNLQSPYPVQFNNGPGPTPWIPQQYGTQIQPPFGMQGPIPAGLPTRSRQTSITSSNNENQPGVATSSALQQHIQPGVPTGSYPPAQLYPAGNPSGNYYLPPGQGPRPPLMIVPPDSPQRGGMNYLQPPQQIQPQYGMKTDPNSARRYASHRRSQSANVIPPTISGLSSAKSPVRELQATPQKPVNFLIHTPKHPPPT